MASREYQSWAVNEVWNYFAQKTGNPVIAMPTGTGKSHVIALLAQTMMYAYPRTRAMVLTHVKELIAQNHAKFLEYWPNAPAGIFSAGLNKKEYHQPITFAGIGSVVNHASKFGYIDILFVDECDLISTSEKTQYVKFIAALKKFNPLLKVIGLTATAWRQGVGSIVGAEGGIFTDFAVDMTGVDAFNWFIEEGYLLPLVPKKTKLEIDISGVHVRGGEYISAELQKAVDKEEITFKALSEALEHAETRHSWLIFAAGVDHAKNISGMLNDLGVRCKAVYSGMEKDGIDRDGVILEFKNGVLQAVSNNNVLTTGFDNPAIDLILMLRHTMSSRLWVQMLGRGTRPFYMDGFDLSTKEGRLNSILASPKQNCLVLDFANNAKRLGPINDPVLPRKKGEKGGTAPIKECLSCKVWNHATVRFCGGKPAPYQMSGFCGAPFTFLTKLHVEASTVELIKGKVQEPAVVETFKVDHITFSPHEKFDRPPAIKVSYYCGLRQFDEYICPEHTNFAGKKARDWWRIRTNQPMPPSTDACMEIIGTLPVATHLRVHMNLKYPEITNTCFDGTAFGQQEAASVVDAKPPTVNTAVVPMRTQWDKPTPVESPAPLTRESLAGQFLDMDDDIPF